MRSKKRTSLLVSACTLFLLLAVPVGTQASVCICVCVDIKPCSWPNPLNLKRRGVLPIAIYGTEDFDVITIDPPTIRLTRESVGVGVSPLRWSYEDVNGDGYLDLTIKFNNQELVETLELDAFSDGEIIPLNLEGNLKEEFDGTPISGQDLVVIIN